jgi:hypothetical protein
LQLRQTLQCRRLLRQKQGRWRWHQSLRCCLTLPQMREHWLRHPHQRHSLLGFQMLARLLHQLQQVLVLLHQS